MDVSKLDGQNVIMNLGGGVLVGVLTLLPKMSENTPNRFYILDPNRKSQFNTPFFVNAFTYEVYNDANYLFLK